MGAEQDRLDKAVGFIDPEKPILLVGIASAAYLCWPAQVFLSNAGLVTRVMNAADALYEEWPALQKANVVINSRSGETGEIVKLASKLKEANIPILGITNEPESTLAQKATCSLWANTRKDDLVSINIVTGMMLTTLLWATKLTGKIDMIRESLDYLPEVVQSVLDHAVTKADQLVSSLFGVRPIYLLARGASLGAAYCGRLVLEEISRYPAVALEAAEFRQGPNEVIDQKFGAILFIPSGEAISSTPILEYRNNKKEKGATLKDSPFRLEVYG